MLTRIECETICQMAEAAWQTIWKLLIKFGRAFESKDKKRFLIKWAISYFCCMFSHFKQNRKTLQRHFKFHTYWWLDLFDDHFFCIIQMCTTNFQLDHFFCIQIAPTFRWIIHPSSYHLQACLNRALSALITSSAALYNLQNTSHSLYGHICISFEKVHFQDPREGPSQMGRHAEEQ